MPQDAVIVAQKDQIHPWKGSPRRPSTTNTGSFGITSSPISPATSRRTASGRHSPGSWSPPGRIQNTSPSSSSISPSRMISALDEWRILCPYASSPYKKVPVRPHRHPSFTESYLSSSSWQQSQPHSSSSQSQSMSNSRCSPQFGHSMPPSNRVSSSTQNSSSQLGQQMS